MKTLTLEQMENVQGGAWYYSWREHVGCAAAGVLAGAGGIGVGVYLTCLLVAY